MQSLTIVAADARVYVAQFGAAFGVTWLILLWEGRRRKWPTGPWLAMLAWTFTCAMVGSHLAMLGSGAWTAALSRDCLPHTTDKSFLGMVAGGIVGVATSRRLLRLPLAAGDAFAIALPVGLAVGRVGCLLRGCCFGTPTSLPWAISYSPGSLAQGLQVQRGLVGPGSASLPIHPVQVYEMLLLVGLIVVLLLARRRLKEELSLFLLYAVLQSLVRFGIEFVRDGPQVAHIAGMKPLQLVLLGVAGAAAVLLAVCERGAFRVSVTTAPSFWRQALAIGAVGAIAVPFAGWFTQFELGILLAVTVPAAFALAFTAVQSARRAPARWAATAVTAGALVMLGAGSDDLFPPEVREPDYWTVTGAAGGGECAEGAYYGGISGTAAFTHEFDTYSRLRAGGQAAILIPWIAFSGGSLFADGDIRWAGLGGGVAASAFGVRPFARVRLGPSDIAWLESTYGDSLLPFLSQLTVGAGVNIGDAVRLHGGYATLASREMTPWPVGAYIGAVTSMDNGTELFTQGYLISRERCWQLLIGVRYPILSWGQ